MRAKKVHSLLTFVLSLSMIYTFLLSVQGCIKQEREALLSFKAGVHDPGKRLASWSGSECCNWVGIRCNNETGRVTDLDLSNPYSYLKYHGYKSHILTGKINPSLLALSCLEYLDLSWNNFDEITGFPDFIVMFDKLKYLNLSSAGFSGTIPPQLGNLSRLQYLDLSNNYGLMSLADVSWLSNLQSLKHLDMSQVNLQDSKEWVEALNKLSMLEVLILDNNTLTHIPQSLSYVNFTSLRVLQISDQNFSTTIPDWIFTLHGLTELSLEQCFFVGSFPVAMGNLTSLHKLSLGCSALQGKIPPLNNLTKLTYVFLSCFLDGKPIDITELLSQFSLEAKRRLEALILYDIHLTGTLKELASEMRNLKYLDLSINKLSGPIPDGFWNLTNLIEVDLSMNELTGSLTNAHLDHLSKLELLFLDYNQLGGNFPSPPYSFDQSPHLQQLSLSNNHITGTIKFPLCMFKSLRTLGLSNNNISGFDGNCYTDDTQAINPVNENPTIALSSLNCSDYLREIYLNNNNLTGGFPSSLQFCRGLICLNLSRNNLNGEIPQWIGENLGKLMSLAMHSNIFSGNIPSKLAMLKKLRVLDLSDNNLSGALPENLGNLTGMTALKFVVDVPSDPLFDTQEYFYDSYMSLYLNLPTSIDLSNNYLTGKIPTNITALTGLVNLNLSHNHFTGEIPALIGRMKSLQSLDLHFNNISGTIPLSIFSLNSLKALNLSYNNLSGSIPSRQLHKVNGSSMYIGNPYLCDLSIYKKCAGTWISPASNNNTSYVTHQERWWMYMIIEFGLVIGCFVLVLVLLFMLLTSTFKRLGKYMSI